MDTGANAVKTGGIIGAFVPNVVLLKMRINKNRARQVIDLGFEEAKYKGDLLEVIHRFAAKDRGVDPERFNREDKLGVGRVDSGTPVFGADKKGRPNVTLAGVPAQLRNLWGMEILGVRIFQKKQGVIDQKEKHAPAEVYKDTMWTLEITFGRPNEEAPKLDLDIDQQRFIKTLLAIVWGHTHIWRNPNYVMTVNCGHTLVDNEMPAYADIRPLIFLEGGRISCIKAGSEEIEPDAEKEAENTTDNPVIEKAG